jgi:hypothetical protein
MRRYLPTWLKRRVRRAVLRTVYDIDRYRYVLIVTYGRSGSTLLMSMLNMIPGYRIQGENYNALHRLFQADAAVRKAYRTGLGDPRHRLQQSPWYGIVRARPHRFREDLVESFVNHVLRPEPGDRVLGFKEIRYTTSDVPDLDGYLAFVRQALPGCKVIFNHRDPASVAQSSWWALNEGSQEKIEAADKRMLAIPADGRHFHFFYDQIDDSLHHVRELFAFLGEKLDERRVRQLIGTRHSPPPVKYAEVPQAPAA